MKMLEGKNAIVTGTNRGIGLSVMEEFAGHGCNIWAVSRQKTGSGETDYELKLEELREKYGVRITPVFMEMSDEESIKASFKEIYQTKLPIDILVNVAGIVDTHLFQMTSMDMVRNVYAVNVFGPMYLTQLVLKAMVRNKRGSIVNVGSISGLDANPTNCTYGSSKAALMHFTKVLASEVGEFGIRVNAVAPGPTRTDMIKAVEDAVGEKEMLSRCALSRCAEAFEVAKVIAFLAGEEAAFVNGQIIRVDGGAK